jgi:hypothetical protein
MLKESSFTAMIMLQVYVCHGWGHNLLLSDEFLDRSQFPEQATLFDK